MRISIFDENDRKLENEDKVSIAIMFLNKVSATLNHKPLIAKLEAYVLDS